jgi:hypothetical protein
MVIALLTAALAVGCVEFDRSIVFNADGSGRASMRMAMDLDAFIGPMVEAIAKGRGGAPIAPAELAAMKQKMLDSMRASLSTSGPTIEVTPVPGATAIDKSVTMDGNRLVIATAFGFSDPSVIRLLKFSLVTPGGTNQAPNLDVFDDLDITTDAGTVVVRTRNAGGVSVAGGTLPSPDALKGLEALLGTDSPLQGMLTKAASTIRLATRIEAPWAIVETNAPARNGSALAWEFKAESLDKVAVAAQNVLVRYKK